ncbi:unnamed protein product [Amoebophrya sp. A25]|nr:unnamed protein product [Amoebophrya sp. A25]|eukprot:GSA25T00008365001.1
MLVLVSQHDCLFRKDWLFGHCDNLNLHGNVVGHQRSWRHSGWHQNFTRHDCDRHADGHGNGSALQHKIRTPSTSSTTCFAAMQNTISEEKALVAELTGIQNRVEKLAMQQRLAAFQKRSEDNGLRLEAALKRIDEKLRQTSRSVLRGEVASPQQRRRLEQAVQSVSSSEKGTADLSRQVAAAADGAAVKVADLFREFARLRGQVVAELGGDGGPAGSSGRSGSGGDSSSSATAALSSLSSSIAGGAGSANSSSASGPYRLIIPDPTVTPPMLLHNAEAEDPNNGEAGQLSVTTSSGCQCDQKSELACGYTQGTPFGWCKVKKQPDCRVLMPGVKDPAGWDHTLYTADSATPTDEGWDYCTPPRMSALETAHFGCQCAWNDDVFDRYKQLILASPGGALGAARVEEIPVRDRYAVQIMSAIVNEEKQGGNNYKGQELNSGSSNSKGGRSNYGTRAGLKSLCRQIEHNGEKQFYACPVSNRCLETGNVWTGRSPWFSVSKHSWDFCNPGAARHHPPRRDAAYSNPMINSNSRTVVLAGGPQAAQRQHVGGPKTVTITHNHNYAPQLPRGLAGRSINMGSPAPQAAPFVAAGPISYQGPGSMVKTKDQGVRIAGSGVGGRSSTQHSASRSAPLSPPHVCRPGRDSKGPDLAVISDQMTLLNQSLRQMSDAMRLQAQTQTQMVQVSQRQQHKLEVLTKEALVEAKAAEQQQAEPAAAPAAKAAAKAAASKKKNKSWTDQAKAAALGTAGLGAAGYSAYAGYHVMKSVPKNYVASDEVFRRGWQGGREVDYKVAELELKYRKRKSIPIEETPEAKDMLSPVKNLATMAFDKLKEETIKKPLNSAVGEGSDVGKVLDQVSQVDLNFSSKLNEALGFLHGMDLRKSLGDTVRSQITRTLAPDQKAMVEAMENYNGRQLTLEQIGQLALIHQQGGFEAMKNNPMNLLSATGVGSQVPPALLTQLQNGTIPSGGLPGAVAALPAGTVPAAATGAIGGVLSAGGAASPLQAAGPAVHQNGVGNTADELANAVTGGENDGGTPADAGASALPGGQHRAISLLEIDTGHRHREITNTRSTSRSSASLNIIKLLEVNRLPRRAARRNDNDSDLILGEQESTASGASSFLPTIFGQQGSAAARPRLKRRPTGRRTCTTTTRGVAEEFADFIFPW